ncbi:MAG: hypothetical protein Q8K58_04180 [Acidimicrobiales bacterium]|nr:hypothetical protein [Acidimicrobiales bacterium]
MRTPAKDVAVVLDAEIARVAREQHALITLAQMRDLGGDRRHLDRRARSGALERVNHTVYRIGGVAPTWESQVLAGVWGAGPGAVASHLTAGALWDLDGFSRAGRPEVSIPRGRHHRSDAVRCHESTDLDRCTVVARAGIPTTDLPRTLLDLGRYFRPPRLARAVESARRSHDLTWGPIVHVLLRHARQGRHGIRRLRTVIAEHGDRDEVTDSDFELLVLALLAEHGIATPVLHHEVWAGDVLIAEVDLAWPERMVAMELNGRVHREEAEVWERDQVKAVELRALGWTVLPFTWRTYAHEPEWLVRRVRDILRG